MGAPRFRHIPDDVVQRYQAFSAAHPGTVPTHVLLQKLVIFDFVAPLVEARPHGAILEIGAGLGIHSALLSRYGQDSATELAAPGSFVGADRDVEAARTAVFRELAATAVRFTTNDGLRLPYDDASFDIVFHNSVIEHVPDVAAFNREVRRVLRPGGTCICITGTPALCRFRLFKDWFLKLPLHGVVAIVREVPLLRELAVAFLRVLGASDATRLKVRERLLRVDDRVRALAVAASPSGPEGPCRVSGLRTLYPRLYHFLYFPDYNRLVVEELAAETGLSVEELLGCTASHFGSMLSRLRFAFTPQTHGQHYRNIWHEMDEWRVKRWRQQFDQAGLSVEDVQGYRYHHLLELTPRQAWNAVIYARAARWVHAAIARRLFDPACASEIIVIAKREG